MYEQLVDLFGDFAVNSADGEPLGEPDEVPGSRRHIPLAHEPAGLAAQTRYPPTDPQPEPDQQPEPRDEHERERDRRVGHAVGKTGERIRRVSPETIPKPAEELRGLLAQSVPPQVLPGQPVGKQIMVKAQPRHAELVPAQFGAQCVQHRQPGRG